MSERTDDIDQIVSWCDEISGIASDIVGYTSWLGADERTADVRCREIQDAASRIQRLCQEALERTATVDEELL